MLNGKALRIIEPMSSINARRGLLGRIMFVFTQPVRVGNGIITTNGSPKFPRALAGYTIDQVQHLYIFGHSIQLSVCANTLCSSRTTSSPRPRIPRYNRYSAIERL